MKKLIGNPFKVLLKGEERSVDGILIETDDHYDYIQREASVCIIPKHNVLYYETNQLSQTSKVIEPPEPDRVLAVYVDKVKVADVKAPRDLGTKDLVGFLCSHPIIQNALEGTRQKSWECFDDSVYILTDRYQEKVLVPPESFSEAPNPLNTCLNPADMVKRLNNSFKKPQ